MAKAVSNGDICYIITVLLMFKHGHLLLNSAPRLSSKIIRVKNIQSIFRDVFLISMFLWAMNSILFYDLMTTSVMVLILDGNTEHVAHA